MNWADFLAESKYVDFSSPNIRGKANELFREGSTDTEKARTAYEFVRDEIPHSFDIRSNTITAKASDVLLQKTGVCHAKSNLLAALLRAENIPVGFCFQHITLAADDSRGYCIHCYNAIFTDGRWIKVDSRGNTNGKNAQFSLEEPILAFPNREGYDEYFLDGIYAHPHKETMMVLENARSLQDVIENLPDRVFEAPDITGL